MLRRLRPASLLITFLPIAAWGQAEVCEQGPEFSANVFTAGDQATPAVGVAGDGTFVVAWDSEGSFGDDSDEQSVQARRFEANGLPIDALEFQVNSVTSGRQRSPALAVGDDGRFVVAWGTDYPGFEIAAQRFDAAASPAGGEFQVNTYTTGGQGDVSVEVDADGDFVVVWTSFGSSEGDTDYSVQVRRFAMDGTPAGAETQVNTYTTEDQRYPDVAVRPSGEFVVVWASLAAEGDPDLWSVHGRRYGATGDPLGDQFQVNTYTTGRQLWPDVAYQPDGGFVVAWSSNGSFGTDDDLESVQVRRFDSAGAPLGPEVQVNTMIEGSQRLPAVTGLADGRFVVAFAQGAPSFPSQAGIGLRVFQADGTPDGGERLVSNGFSFDNYAPSVAAHPAGPMLVAWERENGSDLKIALRRYHGLPLFCDGFESGDLAAWALSVP